MESEDRAGYPRRALNGGGLAMRLRSGLAILALCCIAPAADAADPVFTEAQAGSLLAPIMAVESCGVIIPLGEQNFPLPEAADGGAKHELALRAIALKDIGVLS